MTPEKFKKFIDKSINVCADISKDVENDIKKMDGQEFNGKNVATQFGYQAAAIVALSEIIKTLLIAIKEDD